MNQPHPRLWAAMPAAGTGSRFGNERAKQYADLLGRPMLQWSLDPLLARDDIAGVMVAVDAVDPSWEACRPDSGKIRDTVGGATRSASVLAALRALSEEADPTDWVLVHDAARPCLHPSDLERLVAEVTRHNVGGLLAVPVTDTIKRALDGLVVATIARSGLWRALTPQMFPLGRLLEALAGARDAGAQTTDEAAAMELAGYRPRLVQGRADNIKVTVPEDLRLAATILGARGSTA